jgi:CheY-like chemotaxis protein
MPRPDALPDPALFATPVPGRAALPLQGLTLLAVEDSRYACDALRLMCQRSGARLRRADSIAAAQAHLRLYRPDVVVVDLGLPDGRGEDLIRSIVRDSRAVILGTSGDPDGRIPALAAGAAGFLDKPLPGLATFQAAVLAHFPGAGPMPLPDAGQMQPDPLSLADDLAQAVQVLEAGPGPAERAWLQGFLSGLARLSGDTTLAAAAHGLGDAGLPLSRVAGLLRAHIARASAFTPGPAG